MIYIFDLDGTLSDSSHRAHYLQQKPKDWGAWLEASKGDLPNRPVLAIADALLRSGFDIWIWTGREESQAEHTAHWVRHTAGLGFRVAGSMRMRPIGDHRPDVELKGQWLDELAAEQRASIMGVFEDRRRMVDFWRSRGVPCFQVAEGDF